MDAFRSGGTKINGDLLGHLMWKRLTITASTLRSRPVEVVTITVLISAEKSSLNLFLLEEYFL